MKNLPFIVFLIMTFLSGNASAQELNTPSKRSQMIYKTLKSVNASEKAFDKLLSNPQRGSKNVSAKKIKRSLLTNEKEVDGFMVLSIQRPTAINKHIIFLHGGAYVSEGTSGHRKLMEDLALTYNFKVSYIDYPLAPEYQARYTFEVLLQAYNMLTQTNPHDIFYLFGDSAGGGLALAFLQTLRNNQAPIIPVKTVLQSPWLDISMRNPEIEKYLDKEVLLDFEGLKECGKLYAGELDLKDPLVSPIYGSMEALGKVKIFVSTHEFFYPDCIALEQKLATARGTSVEIEIYKGLMHDWIIVPSKERDDTIQKMAAFFLED